MSWIPRDGNNILISKAGFILLLLGLCPDEEKQSLSLVPKSSVDPLRIAISLENRATRLNLHCQTPLVILALSIEYP